MLRRITLLVGLIALLTTQSQAGTYSTKPSKIGGATLDMMMLAEKIQAEGDTEALFKMITSGQAIILSGKEVVSDVKPFNYVDVYLARFRGSPREYYVRKSSLTYTQSESDIASESNPDYRLIGISVEGEDKHPTSAIIENKKLPQTYYVKVGDIFNGDKCIEITSSKVVYERSGVKYELV